MLLRSKHRATINTLQLHLCAELQLFRPPLPFLPPHLLLILSNPRYIFVWNSQAGLNRDVSGKCLTHQLVRYPASLPQGSPVPPHNRDTGPGRSQEFTLQNQAWIDQLEKSIPQPTTLVGNSV